MRTANGGRLPDFVIVGSPKCGTTTLYQHLQRHPDVFMSTPKEPSFFSRDERYRNGLESYCELFAGAADHQRCGEASTTYTRWPTFPNTVDRLADAAPHVKLLYLVRNPVDRLYSFYAHRMRERATMDMDTFLDATPEALHSGMYMSQIEQLLRRFPREQLCVLLLEDLIRDTPKTLEQVARFLGLPQFDFGPAGRLVANRGDGHHAATQKVTAILRTIKRTPLVGHAARLAPAAAKKRVFRWLQEGPVGRHLKTRHNRQLTPMSPALRRRLFSLLEEDLAAFESFLGRDLSHWNETQRPKVEEQPT
ncbi:sulfotransferase domain-containing protein [Botrimarina colliarenosi]|uniref:sulfotransferase domain-containing protein n=1 Tax=Botrimarina colliarenosi TaxID=2528001 RepID=UPI001E44FA17|nr:sulfotransferase domain-containing protein [Botrimarina colliarenosi]